MLSPAASQMSTRKAKCVLVFMGKSRLDSPVPHGIYTPMLLRRVAFPDFCEPCLPSPAEKPPAGAGWLHEISVMNSPATQQIQVLKTVAKRAASLGALLTSMVILAACVGRLPFESPKVVEYLDGNYRTLASCTHRQLGRQHGQLTMTDLP